MTDFLAFSQTPLFIICITFFIFFTLLFKFFLILSYFSYLALNYLVFLILFHLKGGLGGLENKFKANYGDLGVTASLPIETKKVTETETDISEIDRRILALQDYLENARYEN